jgi:drug/metabolite transporter (DMT)-like permease
MTYVRLFLAVPAIILLFVSDSSPVDWIGVLMMLAAAALYALHLPINQRVLYDLPAPTVTVYTLLAMSAIVVPTFFFSGSLSDIPLSQDYWWPLIGLTVVTFLSRLTLFTGVKHLGGMQTALLGLSELLITVWLAQLWLRESLSWQQWIGAGLLSASLFLMAWDNPSPPKNRKGGWFSWFSASPIQSPSENSWDPED